MTWQVNQQNKFAFTMHDAKLCYCPQDASLANSLEGADRREYPLRRISTGEWTTPLTDRVLLEFGGQYIQAVSDVFPYQGTRPEMIRVTDQGTGMSYRATGATRIARKLSIATGARCPTSRAATRSRWALPTGMAR